MIVKSDDPILGVCVFTLIEGTYEANVCDCCGQKRRCDYYYSDNQNGRTFVDLCRSCRNKMKKV